MTRAAAPVRIGLLGLGQMGRNHLRVLSLLRTVDLAFVYDADGELARRVAAQHGVPAVADPVVAANGVDAVIVCTPTATHAGYVEALAGRVAAMFVEKPLAHSLQAAEALRGPVEAHGTRIQVGFIERYNPAVIGLARVLGAAPRVINVDFVRTSRLSARITDVDVIMDLMIHDIDLALYLNGPVRTLGAQGTVEEGVIELASAQLVHANGRFSRLHASRITEKKMRQIQATCSDCFVDCDLLRKEIAIHRQSVIHQTAGDNYTISSQQEAVLVSQQESLLSELQAFVAMVRGEVVEGWPDFRAGVEALRIAEEIRLAIGGGR